MDKHLPYLTYFWISVDKNNGADIRSELDEPTELPKSVLVDEADYL